MAEALNPKRFTSTLSTPNKLDFSIRSEIQQNWKRFHRQWKNYAIASRLQEENAEFPVAIFMTCKGDEALDIIEGLPLTDLSSIIIALEFFCIGERNEVFESYTFHKRYQKTGESIDTYYKEQKHDEDRMIRDRLVIGIVDDKTREKLLEKKQLTLGEALDICRAQEQATAQAKQMSAISAGNAVDRVQSGYKKKFNEVHAPTNWCAPIVAVPKDNGGVRICVDLTKLNESVRRENFPLRTADQLLVQLSRSTIFTKLDRNKGFHQTPLTQESQELTTFITPFSRFAYKRMPFGISSGPEIFHREMCHLLERIPGVIFNIDDILVSGKTQKDHDEKLSKRLEKLKQAGITLNEKCMFSVSKLKFLGHIVSDNGVEIDPTKVESITELPQPQNISGIRRLLGMVNQGGNFIDNLATMAEPLRQLLKKESAWVWTPSHVKSFRDTKEALSTAPVLAHCGTRLETKVSSDASKFGLGSVLFQKKGEDWKHVMFASRSMTSTEQRYAQIEMEALAATWAFEKFSDSASVHFRLRQTTNL
ncbi:Pol polyprotein [Elysia marginata]|uniref:Pol polyprotein n=1 Tax=Elysia marginata TaxID=1093978 RepID=A0AAV4F0A4_9GAST|nr:Pol polyprotein [Elysia marginata]